MDSVAGQTGKWMGPCHSASDLISNLPTEVVEIILSCLPLKDAARTSILSSKWRFNWLYIPAIVFDGDYFHSGSISSQNPEEVWLQIYRILTLHRGPLIRFVLCAKYVDIDKFIVSPSFTGFRSLTSVELLSTEISADDFKIFVSKCPALERLILKDVHIDGTLEIDAPNLKFFYFSCYGGYIFFKNVPVLSTVIMKRIHESPLPMNNTVRVFDSLPAVEYFCASPDFLLDSSGGDIPQRLPSMLEHLQSVKLSELSFNSSMQIQYTLMLIRSSPNLRKIKIKIKTPFRRYDDVDIEYYLKALTLLEGSFNKLQEVTMTNFNATFPELGFLKIILAESLVLKEIMIQLAKGIFVKEDQIMEVVSQFQTASPNATIVFLEGSKG